MFEDCKEFGVLFIETVEIPSKAQQSAKQV